MAHTLRTIEQIETKLDQLEKNMIDEQLLEQYELESEMNRRASFFTPIFVAALFTVALLLINHFRG